MLDFIPDPTAWGVIVGFLLPLVTSVVQQPTWSTRTRVLVSLVASTIVGIVTVLVTTQLGDLDTSPVGILATIAAVITAAEATYQKLWQPSGIAGSIERATSRARHRAEDPYPA